jgi:hypothetical protein
MQKSSNLVVDMNKAITRWKPIVEKLGVTNAQRISELCEYAEMHSAALTAGMVKENVAYANPANTSGMGGVVMPGINGTPGIPGAAGSGDLGQTLLPASLKIAANTPGLELLPTINVNSNRVDLLYFDFKYDDVLSLDENDERASTFKFTSTAVTAALKAAMLTFGVTELRGRISAPLYWNFTTGVINTTGPGTGSKASWLQFKGFARIDEKPMFRAWIQSNTASSGQWTFSAALNTFPVSGAILTVLNAGVIDSTAPFDGVAGNVAAGASDISMVSLNEDFIDDFTSSRKATPMTRGEWDTDEAGKIGPDSFVKSVQIGVVHVSGALRLSEIGDYKRMYGVDIVERTKAQLVNQIQQKMSVEIVEKVKEMGLKNRATAPSAPAGLNAGLVLAGITDGTMFDMSVSATAGALGGEQSASIARKLVAKIHQASAYVATDGRIGGIDYIISSGTIVSTIRSIAGYTVNPFDAKLGGPMQLQPAGTIDGIKVYIDPYMNPADLTVYMGRVGTKEDPGLKFLAYMLAESVEIISEKTMAPRLYMYSRYAITEFGYFPEKQYMALKVEDVDGILL